MSIAEDDGNAGIAVYLDNDARREGLALHAVRTDGTWNGWAIPVATAAEFRRFIAANANDDGSWLPDAVCERVGFLTYSDGYSDGPDEWQAIGTDEHGTALYALDGWTWSL